MYILLVYSILLFSFPSIFLCSWMNRDRRIVGVSRSSNNDDDDNEQVEKLCVCH